MQLANVATEESNKPINKVEFQILLVDDNVINQLILKRMLEFREYKVTGADNGLNAFEILQEHSFDLILMDIQMPVMDGLECTHKVRHELNIKTPIIAVTASASSGDKEAYLLAGINDVIEKPVVSKILYTKINHWLVK